jgi:hypothetical protein
MPTSSLRTHRSTIEQLEGVQSVRVPLRVRIKRCGVADAHAQNLPQDQSGISLPLWGGRFPNSPTSSTIPVNTWAPFSSTTVFADDRVSGGSHVGHDQSMASVEYVEIEQVSVSFVPPPAFEITRELRDPSRHESLVHRGEARHP